MAMIFAQDQWVTEMEDIAATAWPDFRPTSAKAATRRDSREPLNRSDPSDLSTEQLAARCQAGCPDSFEQIVLRFEDRIFNFLHQFTRNRHDAEDLTQVTFLKAYQSLPRYRPSLAFAPWLFTIARRTAASHFRSLQRFEPLPVDGQIDQTDPAGLLASKDEQTELWQLARTLKPRLWEALWLRYGEDFSVADIARVMRTNQIHVKVLLHRARAALARKLAAAGVHAAAGPVRAPGMKGLL